MIANLTIYLDMYSDMYIILLCFGTDYARNLMVFGVEVGNLSMEN